jgi:hypothetical protein
MPKIKIFAAALALALGAQGACAAGVFSEFGGSWKGTGRVSDIHGKSEALSCKSSNNPSQDGVAMALSLVCASDSYRVDFHADLYTDGQALHGTWSEKTRDASGNVEGDITPQVIHATTTAPGFSANIVIHVSAGKKLDVDLKAHGTSIDHVAVSMKR